MLTVSLLIKASEQLSVFLRSGTSQISNSCSKKMGKRCSKQWDVKDVSWARLSLGLMVWRWLYIISPSLAHETHLCAVQTCSVTHLFFIFRPDSLGSRASFNSFVSLCSLQTCCLQFQAKGIKPQRCFQMEPFIAALTSLPKLLTTVPAK